MKKLNLIAVAFVVATCCVLPAYGQGGNQPFVISESTWQMCREEGITVYEECVLAKAAVSYTAVKGERDELQTQNAHLRGQVANLEDENAHLRGRVISLEDAQSRLEAKLDDLLAASATGPAPSLTTPAMPAAAPVADPLSVAWSSEPRNHEFAALTGLTWESCEDMGLCTAFVNQSAYSITIDVGGVRTVIGRSHGVASLTPAPTTHGAETLVGPGQRVYLYVGESSFDATYTAYVPIRGTFVPSFTKTVTNVKTKGANPFKGIGRGGWSSL